MTKQQIRWIPFAALLTVFTASLGWAESIPPANVKGEVIKIEGATYVVKDTSGKEVKLQVDATTTKKDGEVKVGDHVDVDVTPQGYARVIRKDGGERMNGFGVCFNALFVLGKHLPVLAPHGLVFRRPPNWPDAFVNLIWPLLIV